MIVAIVGGRDFKDYDKLKQVINKIQNVDKIVSGGAIGADTLGHKYAKEFSIEFESILPNWKRYGKSAGFRRNELIVLSADIVVAFWDNKSKGTAHSINLARKMGKVVKVVFYNHNNLID